MDEEHLTDLICRLDRRRRLFPAAARCAVCGETNPLLLVAGRGPVVCQTHLLLKRGRDPNELHHLGGRPSTSTILVPANMHALLSFLQEVWRGSVKAGSNEAYLFDLLLVRAIGPSLGIEPP